MSCEGGQIPGTASLKLSIWRELPEDEFRRRLVALEERTNAVPIRPEVFPLVAKHRRDWFAPTPGSTLHPRILSIEVEQTLANDLAFIAAVGEGAQSVSAVCIEEHFDPIHLTLRFAAVDTIDGDVRNTLCEIVSTLSNSTSKDWPVKASAECLRIFELIVRQNRQKILGRLRSHKWHKPKYLSRTHKKSLWQDFDNLIHRAHFVYPKKKDLRRAEIETQLASLAQTLKDFEDIPTDTDTEFTSLLDLLRTCYTFCTSNGPRAYAGLLESSVSATPQIAASIKTLRQIEKLAAYWRIPCDLVKTARKFPTLFTHIDLEYLQPYRGTPTEIGYESWARTSHVHAEVQLAVYYDNLSSCSSPRNSATTTKTENHPDATTTTTTAALFHQPRVIGTSKHLCYLCYLFLTHHDTFAPNNTHGRLYDQWTIPDLGLDVYNPDTIRKYQRIIREINHDVVSLTNELGPKQEGGKRDAWRVEPMTSRENLLLSQKEEERML